MYKIEFLMCGFSNLIKVSRTYTNLVDNLHSFAFLSMELILYQEWKSKLGGSSQGENRVTLLSLHELSFGR